MLRLSALVFVALTAAVSAAAPPSGVLYELEWRVAASVSRVEDGGLRTTRGEMSGTAELVLRTEAHGVLVFDWKGSEGTGNGMIGPGGPEHVSFPVPPEVGFPPAPPDGGGGHFTWEGERQQPAQFKVTWIEAFYCRTAPAACDNIARWERGFVGVAKRIRRQTGRVTYERPIFRSSLRSLYSIESTSACHEASMMFSATPTVPHVSAPSPDVISTRVCAAVPFDSSRIRTL